MTTTNEEIDEALERAKEFASFPRIVEAVYRSEPELEFLMLRLSNGIPVAQTVRGANHLRTGTL